MHYPINLELRLKNTNTNASTVLLVQKESGVPSQTLLLNNKDEIYATTI